MSPYLLEGENDNFTALSTHKSHNKLKHDVTLLRYLRYCQSAATAITSCNSPPYAITGKDQI